MGRRRGGERGFDEKGGGWMGRDGTERNGKE